MIFTPDMRPGCPGAAPADTDLVSQTITVSAQAVVQVSADMASYAIGRRDLYLLMDGMVVARSGAQTDSASPEWTSSHLGWSGTLSLGTHMLSLRSPNANVFGCGTQWGNVSTLLIG